MVYSYVFLVLHKWQHCLLFWLENYYLYCWHNVANFEITHSTRSLVLILLTAEAEEEKAITIQGYIFHVPVFVVAVEKLLLSWRIATFTTAK